MTPKIAGALALAIAVTAPLLAAANPVPAAKQVVSALEAQTGMPIAILERTGDDPGVFWYRAMHALCAKTGDNWCEQELRFLDDTTNPLGWARVIEYRNDKGEARKVCAMLPPRQGISPGFVATGLSGGGVYNVDQLPTSAEAEAFLWMLHAANCQNSLGDRREEKRADAFAAMSLALIQGATGFVSGVSVTPARYFSLYRNGQSTRWAVNVAERLLLDVWKAEAAGILSVGGACDARVVGSTNLATDQISRDQTLPPGRDCVPAMGGQAAGDVSDGNLWLWMGGAGAAVFAQWPTVPAPPQLYSPFKPFPSLAAGVSYVWQSSEQLAAQY